MARSIWSGAFTAYFLLNVLGLNYWFALILSPLIVGALGALLERLLLRRLAGLDPLYSLLLTFGLALVIQGMFQNFFGASGMPYPIPAALTGARNLGFMFLPNYRAWVIVFSADRLFFDMVPDREDAAWRLSARGDGKSDSWCAPSASTCRA